MKTVKFTEMKNGSKDDYQLLEKLEKNVKGLGSISFLDQLDGIIRSLPLIVQFDKKIYPTMGLEMVRVGSKQKTFM
mgnify:CR=1 FL=1